MTSVQNEKKACNERKAPNIPPSYSISQETLEAVKQATNEDVTDTVALFKALSDPLRLRILEALHIADLCVCVLVELLDCEYSKLSYHLKLLKEAGRIESSKDRNFLIYHLTALGEAVLKQIEALQAKTLP